MSKEWRKVTHEQRAVLIERCFRMAFVEHENEVSKKNEHVGVEQVAMFQKDITTDWGIMRLKVSGILSTLEELVFCINHHINHQN